MKFDGTGTDLGIIAVFLFLFLSSPIEVAILHHAHLTSCAVGGLVQHPRLCFYRSVPRLSDARDVDCFALTDCVLEGIYLWDGLIGVCLRVLLTYLLSGFAVSR